MTGTDEANGRSAGPAVSAAGGAPGSIPAAPRDLLWDPPQDRGGHSRGVRGRRSRGSSQGRAVRDREVLLLAAFCVVVVLGLQFLGIVFPPFADAIGRPPTVIVALVVVTLVVLGRALWASIRRG